MNPNEQKMVDRLAEKAHLTNLSVSRRSEREYDLILEGNFGKGSPMAGCAFTGWLPLFAVRELVLWTSREVAQYCDYPEMCEEGDWSGMRDSLPDNIWYIFHKFAV